MLSGDMKDRKPNVEPEELILSLARLRDFLAERVVKELLLPAYDPNRGRLHPLKLYALIYVVFPESNIEVYLHKKNHLSIG